MENEKSFFYMYVFPVILVSLLIFGVLDIFVFNWVYDSEPHFKIIKDGIEVEEITACCFDIEDLKPFENLSRVNKNTRSTTMVNNYSAILCFTEENLEYFEAPCESLKKEDLTIEWLDLNAECIDENYVAYRDSCENDGKDSFGYHLSADLLIICSQWKSFLEESECSKYKFGKYIIEVSNE